MDNEFRRIVFATNNLHKLAEAQQIIGSSFSLLSLKDINFMQEIPEEQDTLEGNASQKAWFLYNKFKIDCFADDTGLEVEVLQGRPGVHSARYAGDQRSDEDNVHKLLQELSFHENRAARFRTVVSLIIDGKEKLFEGIVNGTIIHELRGNGGFGYDPIFVPLGYSNTFSEMDLATKNSISHRGIALQRVAEYLNAM